MHKFIVRLPSGGKAGDKQKPSSQGAPQTKCKASSKGTQMYLDLGQKSFGATQTCKLCNMFFVKDDDMDCKNHEEYCKRRAHTLVLPSLLGHTIVRDLKEEQRSVIHVNRKDGQHKPVVEAVLDAICTELGSCTDLVTDSDAIYMLVEKSGTVLGCFVCEKVVGTRCARIKSSEDAALHSVHKSSSVSSSNELGGPTAVFHGKKRCLLAEQQTSHKRNKAEHSQGENNDIYNEISQTVVADTESSCNGIPSTRRALVGVKLMWVSPTHRRQRVARTLLDTVRQCFVFGTVVSVADLVFSQPTQDGFAFASSYCQSDTVNAYA